MKQIPFLLVAVATVAGVVASMAIPSGRASEEASPIYGVTIPSGYRDSQLISVTRGCLIASASVKFPDTPS